MEAVYRATRTLDTVCPACGNAIKPGADFVFRDGKPYHESCEPVIEQTEPDLQGKTTTRIEFRSEKFTLDDLHSIVNKSYGQGAPTNARVHLSAGASNPREREDDRVVVEWEEQL